MKKDADFKSAVPRDKSFKVTDSTGLHLYVSPSGGKSSRYNYTFGGKKRRIVFGPYPEITLKRPREMRDDGKRLLREGRDPGLQSQRAPCARLGTRTPSANQHAPVLAAIRKPDICLRRGSVLARELTTSHLTFLAKQGSGRRLTAILDSGGLPVFLNERQKLWSDTGVMNDRMRVL